MKEAEGSPHGKRRRRERGNREAKAHKERPGGKGEGKDRLRGGRTGEREGRAEEEKMEASNMDVAFSWKWRISFEGARCNGEGPGGKVQGPGRRRASQELRAARVAWPFHSRSPLIIIPPPVVRRAPTLAVFLVSSGFFFPLLLCAWVLTIVECPGPVLSFARGFRGPVVVKRERKEMIWRWQLRDYASSSFAGRDSLPSCLLTIARADYREKIAPRLGLGKALERKDCKIK